ncbi:hypothetical protein [Bradyrhizobium sp. DASA03007]|uniref:hypothetical protein n=1 Tax=unclassified Bradyrhizobium TaxID=2631580 RepID=UPI003F71595F
MALVPQRQGVGGGDRRGDEEEGCLCASSIRMDIDCWSWLKLDHDGLERDFNQLEGGVCTTCAPGDQRESNLDKRSCLFALNIVDKPRLRSSTRLNTATGAIVLEAIASAMTGARGPELPIQVVQP